MRHNRPATLETITAAFCLPMWGGHLSVGITALPLHRSGSYSRRTAHGREMLAPLAGSPPLLRWAQGPLSVLYRPGIPAYELQTEAGSRACDYVPPRVPWYWTLWPHLGGFRCHLASLGFGPCLPTQEGSSATTRPVALGPTSLIRRASELPCISWIWTPPPNLGGLQHRHVSHNYLWGMDKEVFGCNG
jgi:hypothetical protein